MALVKGKTLVEQTTERIIEYIAKNKMQPGQQLPTEAEFTAELGVSRGTLRDAFKVLIDKCNHILDWIKHVIDLDKVTKARMDLVRWMLAILEIHVRHFTYT